MLSILFTIISVFTVATPPPDLANDRFEIFIQKDRSWVVKEKASGNQWTFRPDFVVITSSEDPKMAMRPAGIENVMYNVVTWQRESLEAADRLGQQKIGEDVAGDGFDDRILKARKEARTADIFKAGELSRLSARRLRKENERIIFSFPTLDDATLSASLYFADDNAFPTLQFAITAKEEKWYSVGYVGAPAHALSDVTEIWQPMVWQEKRFPEKSFLTLAFQSPIPSTLVCGPQGCSGVVAAPKEFPFQPLPLLDNSRFGIALRTEDGKAKSMLFAPAPGGTESHMKEGATFTFEMKLYVGNGNLANAYETVARDIYKFKDYRKNATHTLNETLDNMLDYGMSKYSWFIDSLKGCAYSTDVPGAVKNVSALNPLQMALLTDSEEIYWKRAHPIMEFLLSREKFLFTLDSTQKAQNPSRKMHGPVAPVSELAALYEISGEKSKALLDLARQEFNTNRTRNLSVEERGDSWQNALALYQASGEKQYLDKAITGADEYLNERVDKPSKDFGTIEKGFFFWNGFTPDWISLLQLYEATGKQSYLDAAQKGARQYTLFAWYSPMIPDDSILVNKDNKAPLYWYLKSKGHKPMTVAEEIVPAWRLSEIGLTPESSGTCSGHRGIFMTNYAPWMLRIGYLKGDAFLMETAKAAVIGRYANFPGYHINTARTTAYEKEDYPLRPFKELSVNSFHFNHIWPHMSILVDYLFTDAFVKSKGKIAFPSTYIEGYAYLQSKFYGHDPGTFYGDKNVYPWMPPALATTSSKQLNYVAFRGNNSLYLVFMNQSPEAVSSSVSLNRELFAATGSEKHKATVWVDNAVAGTTEVKGGHFSIDVNPGSISAVKIEGLHPDVSFQKDFYQNVRHPSRGLISLKAGNARAMVLDFGKDLRTLYLYLRDDDRSVSNVQLRYSQSGEEVRLTDETYPFEFSVPVSDGFIDGEFALSVTGTDGQTATETFTTETEN